MRVAGSAKPAVKAPIRARTSLRAIAATAEHEAALVHWLAVPDWSLLLCLAQPPRQRCRQAPRRGGHAGRGSGGLLVVGHTTHRPASRRLARPCMPRTGASTGGRHARPPLAGRQPSRRRGGKCRSSSSACAHRWRPRPPPRYLRKGVGFSIARGADARMMCTRTSKAAEQRKRHRGRAQRRGCGGRRGVTHRLS
jgi:hypothetical protein